MQNNTCGSETEPFFHSLYLWLNNILKQGTKPVLACGAVAVGFGWWYNFYRGFSQEPLHLLTVFAILFVLLLGGVKYNKKRENICILVFSVFYSFFLVLTHYLRMANGSALYIFIRIFIPFILICGGMFLLLRGLYSAIEGLTSCEFNPHQPSRKIFLWFLLIITALWGLVFLAVGPKISPDTTTIINEALNGPINDYHPVMYTLALRLFILPFNAIGQITIGAYLFCFAQLLLIAAIAAYVCYTLYKHGAPLWLSAVALLYYATSIVFAVNSVTIWKDTLFNASLLLLMCFLYRIYDSDGIMLKDKKFMLKLAALCIGICFLRGTGWFICVAVTILLSIIYFKSIKALLIWLLPVIIIVKIITGPVYAALNIGNMGSTEIAGMMLQQVGRVASSGGDITPAQAEVINRVINVDELGKLYNQHSPDYIKRSEHYNSKAFDENLVDFAAVWLQIGIQNPGTYFTAWALQTIGFWSLRYNDSAGVFYNDYNGYAGINGQDLISAIIPADLAVGDEILANLNMFSLGDMIWLLLFCGMFFIAKKESKKLVVLSPALFLWAGLLMGAPRHYEFRYIMIVPLAMPLVLFLLLKRGKKA